MSQLPVEQDGAVGVRRLSCRHLCSFAGNEIFGTKIRGHFAENEMSTELHPEIHRWEGDKMESQNSPENKKDDYKIVEETNYTACGSSYKTKLIFNRSIADILFETEKRRLILPGTVKITLLRTPRSNYILEKRKGEKTTYELVSKSDASEFVRERDVDAYVHIFNPTLI